MKNYIKLHKNDKNHLSNEGGLLPLHRIASFLAVSCLLSFIMLQTNLKAQADDHHIQYQELMNKADKLRNAKIEKGGFHLQNQKSRLIRTTYNEALGLLLNTHDTENMDIAELYHIIGNFEQDMRMNERALNYYIATMNIYDELSGNDSEHEQKILAKKAMLQFEMGFLLHKMSDHQRAEIVMSNAIEAMKKHSISPLHIVSAMRVYANHFIVIGENELARTNYDEAMSLFNDYRQDTKLQDEVKAEGQNEYMNHEALALQLLGTQIMMSEGEIRQALAQLDTFLLEIEAINTHQSIEMARAAQHLRYFILKQEGAAKPLIQAANKAIHYSELMGLNDPAYWLMLEQKATYHYVWGDFDGARSGYLKLLSVVTGLNHFGASQLELRALNYLVSLEIEAEQYEEAIGYANQYLIVAEQSKDDSQMAATAKGLVGIAEILKIIGAYEEAKKFYSAALEDLQHILPAESLIMRNIYYHLADMDERNGFPEHVPVELETRLLSLEASSGTAMIDIDDFDMASIVKEPLRRNTDLEDQLFLVAMGGRDYRKQENRLIEFNTISAPYILMIPPNF